MLTLPCGIHDGLKVNPRWPSRQVRISKVAWTRLLIVQDQLPTGARLIVTRGYEPRASKLGASRKLFRAMGIKLFRLIYKARRGEVDDIFGANGHDLDGNHVDVSVELNKQRLRFLPLGVFTPILWQATRTKTYAATLDTIRTALVDQGFRIHSNQTESLQIHCDLIL